MAWRTDRRGARRSSDSSRSSVSRGRGGRRRAPRERTDQDVARRIEQSALRVRVALELRALEHEAKRLGDVCLDFERTFDVQRSCALTARHDVCVRLLECGLDKWQHLVELQRVLAALKRPEEKDEQLQLQVGMTLQQDVTGNKWTYSVVFARVAEDALWRVANNLMLRLKSCDVLSIMLLPTNQLAIPLLSWDMADSTLGRDKYEWEGTLVWSQVVLDAAAGDEREVIQRVVVPRFAAAMSPASVLKLQYPGLVPLVEDMLCSNRDSGKPVVVILRGVPGSGKSTLGREIKAICSHKGVALTMCSADTNFATPRGYVFNGKELTVAHEKCREDFMRAITGAISEGHKQSSCYQHIVLVDNTSTQKWEYAPYESTAHTYGSRVHIVEMKCPDVLTAYRMGQRNSHGVPPLKVVTMYLRWEEDRRAHSFTPQFDHALLSANPLSDSDVGKLIYIGLFLEGKSRAHLSAQIPAVHSTKFADHVTLFYQPNLQYTRDVELGAPFSIYGVEVVQNCHGQTLRVEVDERLHLQGRNKVPHITLSTINRVPPVYSNDLLSISSAKRTAVDPPLNLRARVGAVFSIEGEQVITTGSPFAVDAVVNDLNGIRRATGVYDVLPQANIAVCTKLLILHVRALADGIEETTSKLCGMAQSVYHMGSGCDTRLLCIQKSQNCRLPVSALMKGVQARVLLSATQSFDDVMIFHEPVSFNEFDETIRKFMDSACLDVPNQVVLLTTDEEAVQWPMCEIKCFQNAALSVSRIGHESVVSRNNSVLESPCANISAMLDLLGINIEEQAQSISLRGISTINDAWARVLRDSVHCMAEDNHAVYRIDTTLMSMSSLVIDFCLVMPSEILYNEVATLQRRLLSELSGARNVRHVVCDSSVPGRFYFSLYTASRYSPVFCVQMTSRSKDSGSGFDKYVAVQLESWQHQLRSRRELCDTEPYSVIIVLIRAILLNRCSSLLPSKCQLSSLINLISERLVLHYFGNTESSGEVDAVPSAADVTSGQIIYTLYRMLAYLSKVNTDEWPAVFGTSLQMLQGDQNARTAWKHGMENVMQHCSTTMGEYPCVAEGLRKARRLNIMDHLQVITALIKTKDTTAGGASSVHACVIVSSHVVWSQVHSLALCDKLRHAAAMVVFQDEDDKDDNCAETEVDARGAFFTCAPSVVARRIDVTTSSLKVLRDVMTKIDAIEAEPAIGHDAAGIQVETEDAIVFDLNQSQLDMQWKVEDYAQGCQC